MSGDLNRLLHDIQSPWSAVQGFFRAVDEASLPADARDLYKAAAISVERVREILEEMRGGISNYEPKIR